MAYKNYTNTFYSERGNRWDVEIWSQSDTSTGNTFESGKGGFKLSYKGSDDRKDVVMPSEVTLQFIIENATQQTFISSLFTSPDDEFFLLIRRNFVVFWWGSLNAGFDSIENDYYPYEVTLKANDFIGAAMNRKDYIATAGLRTLANYIPKMYLDYTDIWSDSFLADTFPLGASEEICRMNYRWTADNQVSYLDTYNVFMMNGVDSAAFEGDNNESGKYKPANAFKELLQAYGLKLFQADGKVYVLQPYSYVDDDLKVVNTAFSTIETLFPSTTKTLDTRQNAENDSSVAPTVDSGFMNSEWLLNPADLSSEWGTVGSVTMITANSFNIALTTSYMYYDLPEGDYCVSYSQNDTTVKIVYANTSAADNDLLTESGQANFSIGATGGRLKVMATTTGTKTIEFVGLQKGSFQHRRFLAGQRWRYQRPISTATATYTYGTTIAQASSNFPASGDTSVTTSTYTSLTGIGAISSDAAAQLSLNINVFYAERFDYLTAAQNFTHIGGTLTLKIQMGSLYLSGTIGDLSWDASVSTFTIPIPIQVNNDSLSTEINENYCNYFAPQTTLSPYFASSGTIGIIGANFSQVLPTSVAGGSVSLQFVSADIDYYINPDISDPNNPPTPLTPVQTNLTSLWLTGNNIDIGNASIPYFSIQNADIEQFYQGVQYSASTGLDNYKTVDFGDLTIGQATDDSSYVNSIRVLNSSYEWEVPSYIQVNNTGTQYMFTSLLLDEWLAPQTGPLKIIEGDYYVNDFSAFKALVLDSEKYVFYEGTFTAESDTVSGSWYKISTASSTITNVDDTIINPPDPVPDPPNPHDDNPFSFHDLMQDLATVPNKAKPLPPTDNLLDYLRYHSIGLSTDVINTAVTKVDLMNNSRAKLYDDQKLIFCKPDYTNAIILTKDGDSATSDTQIDVDGFTPSVEYPKGSILAVLPYDLTNVITGGGGTPAGSDKEVQFNDGGAFGAEATFEYDKTTNFLTADNVEAQHYGTNIGFRTSWSDPQLTYFLNPSDFSLSSKNTVNMYTRDNGGSVVPNLYDSRSNDIYALIHLPEGYKMTAVYVNMSQNRSFDVSHSDIASDTVTSIETGGTANTALLITPNYTIDARDYIIIRVEYDATTDEIWGGKIILEKL